MSIVRENNSDRFLSTETSSSNTGDQSPHLVWVFAADLGKRMDSATWLDTTRELRVLGWHVTLIGMGPQRVQVYRDVEAYCIPRRNTYLLGQLLFHIGVLRFILGRWDNIDVILFNQNSGVWLFPLKLLRRLQGKERPMLVMDTRDLNDFRFGNVRSILRNAYMRSNNLLANRVADGQTTITPRFVQLVNIPQTQLLGTWPSGVNPEPFADAAHHRQWPQGEEPIKLVYIGTLLEKRHSLQLCQAVNLANETGMNFELYYFGDGPQAGKIRQCAQLSGGNVKLLPPIAHEDVPSMLAEMHIGVTSLPDVNDAKYAASSPIKMFEYMASGLPMLATRNPCHKDVVGDGPFTFWIDEPSPAGILDALVQIWSRRDALEAMGLEAQGRVEQWTWPAAAAKLDIALKSGLERQSVETY